LTKKTSRAIIKVQKRETKRREVKTMKKIKVFLKNAKLLNIILAVIVDMVFYAKPEVFELVHIEAKKV
jgi:hypothetical protein